MRQAVQHAEVLELIARAHLRVEPAFLGHVADPLTDPRVDGLTAPAHRPGIRDEQAAHDPHRRRLAGPVAADEAEQRPGRDREAEAVQGDQVAEGPAQSYEFESVR